MIYVKTHHLEQAEHGCEVCHALTGTVRPAHYWTQAESKDAGTSAVTWHCRAHRRHARWLTVAEILGCSFDHVLFAQEVR